MKLGGKSKADFGFRRKRSLTGSAKNMEAVGQTAMPVFLAVRLLGSVSGLRNLRSACSKAAVAIWGSTGSYGRTFRQSGHPDSTRSRQWPTLQCCHLKDSSTLEPDGWPMDARRPELPVRGIRCRSAVGRLHAAQCVTALNGSLSMP